MQIHLLPRRKQNSRAARGYRSYRGAKQPVRAIVWLLICALEALLSLLLWLLTKTNPAVSRLLRQAAQAVSAGFSHITGIIPFPVNEWLIGLGLLGLLGWLTVTLIRRRWQALLRGLGFLVFLAGLALLIFTLFYQIHHTAPSLASRMGLEVAPYTQQELEDFISAAVEEINLRADAVPRDSAGSCAFGSFRALSRTVDTDYHRLQQQFPALEAHHPAPVKQSLLGGRIMSLVNLSGYYFPWTAESIVSTDVVQTHLPFDIAHEEAHALGVGPEAECNFCAFLLCTGSEDLRLQYSGWLNAYIYANNALHSVDSNASAAQYAALCDSAKRDLHLLNETLAQFEGPLHQIGTAVNHSYLLSTGQKDGIRSYGKVVDLMVAFRQQQSAEDFAFFSAANF